MTVDPKNTTQTCSDCGHIMSGKDKLTLKVREWRCPKCGAYHIRDVNAAKNILAKAQSV
ncbi:MAG: transposase [Selenomonadaceae bacterium]|nr:transposase [Selenomonadaceae bacterium]